MMEVRVLMARDEDAVFISHSSNSSDEVQGRSLSHCWCFKHFSQNSVERRLLLLRWSARAGARRSDYV